MPNNPGPASTLLGVPVDTLNLFVDAVAGSILALSVAVAALQLILIRKQQYFEAHSSFTDRLEASRPHREYLFTQFTRQEDYSNAKPADIECATQVINFLNTTAMLIYEGRLPCDIVFRLFHTGIIRCWYQLKPYALYKEKVEGGRYARLVGSLARRAMRFHDARPLQREHPIYVVDKSTNKKTLIYKTRVQPGAAGLWQRLVWRIQWTCKLY